MHQYYIRELSESEKRFLGVESIRLKNLASKEIGIYALLTILLVGGLTGAGICYFYGIKWYFGAISGAAISVTIKLMAWYQYFARYREFKKKCSSVNEASVTVISASRIIEFKEYEDLGVIYCFEIERERFFVLNGQEYYETPRFPCLKFEIVNIKGILYTVRPKSPKHTPDRYVSEIVSRDLQFYENEVIVDGRFEDIEVTLQKVVHSNANT